MKRVLWLAVLGLAACPRNTRTPLREDPVGQSFPLTRAPSLRLEIDGFVDETPARVKFDISTPLSTVSGACFEVPPVMHGRVKVPLADGTWVVLSEIALEGVAFGDVRLPPFNAGVIENKDCEVSLGSTVLALWSLEVDPSTRSVHFERSKDRAAYEAAAGQFQQDEVHVLEVTRAPSTEWPLVPVQVRQGEAKITLPFLLSTRDTNSSIAPDQAAQAGLKKGLQLLDGLPLPAGLSLPKELEAYEGFAYDALELAPGVGANIGNLTPLAGWKGKSAAGILGGDVWGRFHATFDIRSNVLMLRRPRVLSSGSTERCEVSGPAKEDRCFSLVTDKGAATATVWRTAPGGVRLHLDALGPVGEVLNLPCAVGFTFAPQDRGASTQHELPWNRLKESMPECAAALQSAAGFRLGLLEEGSLSACPGTCAFAKSVSGKTSCECQGGRGSEMDQHLLDLFRTLLQQELKKRRAAEEPDDPR